MSVVQSSSLGRQRALGATLVLCSAAFFSLTGVLTKSIASDSWTILGWRGVVGGLSVLAYVVAAQRRSGGPIDLRLGPKGWLVAGVSAIASIFFISSFKLTSVAHVVVIYATVPFMAAGIAFFAFGEKPAWRTLLAALAALGGVAVTVSGASGEGQGLGDALAVVMTLLSALYLVLVRAFRDTPTVWASGVAAFVLMIPAMLFGNFSTITALDGLLMTLFGLSFAVAVIFWTEGARLIPAPEAGLLGTAEIPMAVVFAWAMLGETQTWASLIGGGVVIAAVALHALAGLRGRSAES